MPGERKHRSPSPKAKRGALNMLDVAALEDVSSSANNNRKNAERITCTIPGSRRGILDRISGGDFRNGDRRVSMRGGVMKPSYATPMNRKERRAAIMSRISRSDDHHHRSRRDDRREEEDERKNGSFREENKPVQRLIDPTYVPKSRAFFDHDDRGSSGDSKWKGRSTYDPRIDFGPRHNRQRSSNWEGFGDRRSRDYGSHRRGDDRKDDRKDGGRKYERYSSGADGLWTHDKFVEFEEDSTDTKKDDMKIVVDSKKRSSRHIDED